MRLDDAGLTFPAGITTPRRGDVKRLSTAVAEETKIDSLLRPHVNRGVEKVKEGKFKIFSPLIMQGI